MDALASNAVVRSLAQDSPFEYGNEALLFLYVWGVCDNNNKSKSVVSAAFLSLLRAFGSLFLVVPLVCGKMPGDLITNCDKYIQYFLGWWLLTSFAERIAGADTFSHKAVSFAKTVAYAIFTGNAAVSAFESGKEVFGGSVLAPLVVGYLGVVGASIVEKGLVAGVNGSSGEFSKDQLLAVFGPLIYNFACTGAVFGYPVLAAGFLPAVIARVSIVLFRLSAEHVDYNECIHYIENVGKSINKTLERGLKNVQKSIK